MSWAERPAGQEVGGYKADSGKPRMDLLPPAQLQAAAAVFTYGAQKYAESPEAYKNNWLAGMRWGQAYAALQRHLSAFWRGESVDSESGMLHIHHALCCMLMLAEYASNPRYAHLDDRPSAENLDKDTLQPHLFPEVYSASINFSGSSRASN